MAPRWRGRSCESRSRSLGGEWKLGPIGPSRDAVCRGSLRAELVRASGSPGQCSSFGLAGAAASPAGPDESGAAWHFQSESLTALPVVAVACSAAMLRLSLPARFMSLGRAETDAATRNWPSIEVDWGSSPYRLSLHLQGQGQGRAHMELPPLAHFRGSVGSVSGFARTHGTHRAVISKPYLCP